jgi:hypothetical protein
MNAHSLTQLMMQVKRTSHPIAFAVEALHPLALKHISSADNYPRGRQKSPRGTILFILEGPHAALGPMIDE